MGTIGTFILIALAILAGIGAILIAMSCGTQIVDGPGAGFLPPTSPTLKASAEIPDHGPPWACARFGADGHDYYTCEACDANYHEYLRKNYMAEVTL